MCARTCLLTIICVVEFWTNTRSFVAAESCDTVRDKCATRVGCGMALYNLYLGCNTVMSGRSDTCTVRCQSALVSLLTAEDEVGREFINCGCNTASCEPTKRRVQNCSKAVLAAMDNLEDDTKVVSCTLAEWICQADTSCYTALRFYLKHCSRMLKGDKCTSRCNNSLNILYRQPKAKKMWNCRCMGDEEFNCLEIRRNTRQLCYNDYRPYHTESSKAGSKYLNGQEGNSRASLWTVVSLVLVYVFIYSSQVRARADSAILLAWKLRQR